MGQIVNTVFVALMLMVLFIVCFVVYYGKDRRSVEADREDVLFSNKFKNYKQPKVKTPVQKPKHINHNTSVSEKVIVKTLVGELEGEKQIVFGSTIYTFLGIPYAEPPVGDSRFSSPERVKRWSDTRSALHFSPICPQFIPKESRHLWPMNFLSEKMSEDCLTLNIWTPDIKPKKLKTVMVWLHGGAYFAGSANLHETDGRVLSSFGDVVVVTFNYRLGVFGFLNTRTEGAPGNMGTYDQALAFEWIRDNIKQFGGDPKKLVPFGESAGAISIGVLMTFNRTKELFSRAITQSGGFLLPEVAKVYENSMAFARNVGCVDDYVESEGSEGSEESEEGLDTFKEEDVDCLKDMAFEKLFEAANTFYEHSLNPFIPVSDGYYEEDFESPTNYIQNEDAFDSMKELLSGIVKDEGPFFTSFMNPKIFTKDSYPKMKKLEKTREMFMALGKNKTDIPEKMLLIAANSLIDGPENDSPLNNNKRLSDAYGDLIITCPTIFLADEFIAKNKTVYMYLFDHRSKSLKYGDWLGVVHYSEVPFVFGYPLRKPNLYTKHEISLSERIMKVWTHFAKTGKVLPQLSLNWPKYSENESYMVLKPNQSSITQQFHEKNCELYKTLLQVSG